MNQIEEIVYHKDQMSLDFNWKKIDEIIELSYYVRSKINSLSV